MAYSIFENTMVDMTYPQIEEAAKTGSCVLLPVSVVEEHGPHICTGTDIYLTQTVCIKIKKRLEELGSAAIIAPPFYWGVNSITDSFVGSFSLKPETVTTILVEILENFNKWGFKNIFLLNFHGDYVHIKTVCEIAQKAHEENNINAFFINSKSTFAQFGLLKEVPYLINVEIPIDHAADNLAEIDIHAGGNETSWMQYAYSDLVNVEVAKTLQPTGLTLPLLKQWLHGGQEAKSITPLGYCGAPANIDMEKAKNNETLIVEEYSKAILKVCKSLID